jgi:YYY domain-containing protein
VIQILVWWLIMQVLGWLALPTAMRIFRWLPDRGYAFSKALGLLLASYFLWVGASTTLLSNDLGGILFSVLLLAAISAFFYLRYQGGLIIELRSFIKEKIRLILSVEVLFALVLVGWAIFRAYVPYKIENTSGEKFMETAFQNAILRSKHFPPLDPWLSGFSISYYYFGYVMMAMLTRFSGAVSGVAFDLYDSLLFALAVVGAFGVVYNLVAFTLKARQKEHDTPSSPGPPIAAGVLGGLLVTLMGNLEGVLESLHAWGVLPASFWNWIDIPGLAESPVTGSWYPGNIFWWWWHASRVIADKDFFGQNIGVQPIDEFPAFSFILGDNHPHVLALPFVLLAIGLALNIFIKQLSKDRSQSTGATSESNAPWWNPPAFTLDNDWLLFVFSALILGSLGFLNTWDLPIYLGVVVLAYGLAQMLVNGHLDRRIVLRCVVLGLGLGILSGLLYIFFYLSFSSQASGVLPYVFPPTRLPQYLVMFGTFIFILTCFMVISLHQQGEDQRKPWSSVFGWFWRIVAICVGLYLLIMVFVALYFALRSTNTALATTIQSVLGGLSLGEAFKASALARLRDPWLMLALSALLALAIANAEALFKKGPARLDQPSEPVHESLWLSADSFVYLLIFTGLALTLIVEFLYLRDSFGVRMNTVFKFYYQAWVMLGVASAYATWWILDRLNKQAGRVLFTLGATLFIALGLVYTLMAIPSRAAGFSGPANLDGASGVAQANPDDWAAIQWLNDHAEEGFPAVTVPVILEAPSVTVSSAYQGGSYTYTGRISTFTGFPTLLGWATHESQWRGNYDEQARREPVIATIYTTSNGQTMLDLLHQWHVSYVILGKTEMDYIRALCGLPEWKCTASMALRKFGTVLQPVFNQGQVTVYKVP